MNTNDLLNELKQNQINESACLVLPSHRIDGALCLTHETDGRWLVSLVERGDTIVENYFDDQDHACRFFLQRVISDPTYFKGFSMTHYNDFRQKSVKLLNEYGFRP